jgi:hypothetical protein
MKDKNKNIEKFRDFKIEKNRLFNIISDVE